MTTSISATRTIEAPPEVIWAILTDSARHPDIDGSGTVKGERGGGKTLTGVGDTFGMKMHMGLPYPITNTVKEYRDGSLIAWAHPGGHRWRYELVPVAGGTQVTETFDWADGNLPGFTYPTIVKLMGHQKNMEQTLERLDTVARADVAAAP